MGLKNLIGIFLRVPFTAISVAVAVLVAIGSFFVYGKLHNPVEAMVSKIVEAETGVNLDKMLPED